MVAHLILLLLFVAIFRGSVQVDFRKNAVTGTGPFAGRPASTAQGTKCAGLTFTPQWR
jgi:hypothetical protein